MKNPTLDDTLKEYKIIVEWSPNDECFIARIRAFPHLIALGNSPEDATREARIAAKGMLEVMRKDHLPPPSADNIIDVIRDLLPLINLSKLSRLSGINRQTLASKLQRGTSFTHEEEETVRSALNRVLSNA